MDEEGLDALSMRRLGQELNSGATSLYWHIRNKDELLDLVLDQVIGEVVPEMPREAGWRETADATARALRRVLVRHRGVAQVMGERPTFGPNALQALEILLTPFVTAGFRTGGCAPRLDDDHQLGLGVRGVRGPRPRGPVCD